MTENLSKVVPEGNGPVPHQDEFGSREPTRVDLYKMFEERFDRTDKSLDKKLDELMERTRETKQH